MEAIDKRLANVVGDQAKRMGGGAGAPSRTTAVPSVERADRLRALNKTPNTTNPDAGSLQYQAADEMRDVAARLQSYSVAPTGDALKIDLPSAWRQGQITGREYLTAQEEYLLSAIRLLTERHRWSPRLFNDTFAGISGSGADGDFQHALSVINTMRLTQRLPFGGEVEARWITRATQQLREQASGRYRQSSELALSTSIPLLRGFGTVAREDIIQAERDLIYSAREFERFRRRYLVNLAQDYFNLIQQRSRILNQEKSLDSFRKIDEAEAARVEAGRRPPFQRSITQNQVLGAQSQLASLNESYRLALDRFKIRLGLKPQDSVVLGEIRFELPEPQIELEKAGELALDYRLDLQTQRDRLDDAQRGVSNAKDQLLPSLDFTASTSLPTDPDKRNGGLSLQPDDLDYSAGITLGLPLDREIERLGLKRSLISLEARKRDYAKARDDIVVAVWSALRRIDLARNQLSLAEQQVKINERRLEEQQLKADEVEPQRIVDSQNDLLRAQNDRDQARTDLRIAVLNYLLESDQLRVAPDGTFQPLPGMDSKPGSAPDQAPSN
ncbi:MAG: TolC family protein [Planctomycetes bacterium]|nr:TolC family protein [Planctomycetota bacterium]